MIEIDLDGQKVSVPEGSMVMHAADKAGTYIPHFCYHKKLTIAANCRMCLVDIEKAPKPMPACATPVTQGMIVQHQERQGDQRAAGGDGVPAHQPPARLPDLRPGRRVPAAGPRGRLRRVVVALRRGQARRLPEGRRPAALDAGDEPLHPLHALRPLRHRGRRRDGARHDPSRRALGDHDGRRRHRRLRALGQHDRPVPGRRDHLQAVPLQRARLGALAPQGREPARLDRRQPDRPGQGRAGRPRPAARERRRQRVLARRPRPLLVRGAQHGRAADGADDPPGRRMEDGLVERGARLRLARPDPDRRRARRRRASARWRRRSAASRSCTCSPRSCAASAATTSTRACARPRRPAARCAGSAARSPRSPICSASSSSARSCARIIRCSRSASARPPGRAPR